MLWLRMACLYTFYNVLTNDNERVLTLQLKLSSRCLPLEGAVHGHSIFWAGVPSQLFVHALGHCCLDCALLSIYARSPSYIYIDPIRNKKSAADELCIPEVRVLRTLLSMDGQITDRDRRTIAYQHPLYFNAGIKQV